jgi:hypothetical protein
VFPLDRYAHIGRRPDIDDRGAGGGHLSAVDGVDNLDDRRATTTSTPARAGTFVGTQATVTAADVPYTWRAGCPVGPAQLTMLHLSYRGFDNQPHVGTMVVNATVVADVFKIFSILFAQHFPIN